MIVRKLRTFWSLKSSHWRLAFEALVLPFVIRSGFSLLGVPRTHGALKRWADCGTTPCHHPNLNASTVMVALKLQRVVNRSIRGGGTCLVRSMTLWAMLRRRHIETELRIGVRKVDAAMEGHAWLERNGQAVNETPENVATYVVFDQSANFDGWCNLK